MQQSGTCMSNSFLKFFFWLNPRVKTMTAFDSKEKNCLVWHFALVNYNPVSLRNVEEFVDYLLWLSYLSILQVVFLVVTGEAWGFLGSRRFLHELDQQSGAVAGLNATLIEEVLFFYRPIGLA